MHNIREEKPKFGLKNKYLLMYNDFKYADYL